jgi:hypothetical protein
MAITVTPWGFQIDDVTGRCRWTNSQSFHKPADFREHNSAPYPLAAWPALVADFQAFIEREMGLAHFGPGCNGQSSFPLSERENMLHVFRLADGWCGERGLVISASCLPDEWRTAWLEQHLGTGTPRHRQALAIDAQAERALAERGV